MKSIVMLSGGIDSSLCLAKAVKKSDEVLAVFFDYGQKHIKEYKSAKKISNYYKVKLLKINLKNIIQTLSKDYIPFRNTIFLSILLGIAEKHNYQLIHYGANNNDEQDFPDCRPNYVKILNDLIKTHTNNIKIITPIINKTKTEIVKECLNLNVPINLTWTCYVGGKLPCKKCSSCRIRIKALKENDIHDC